MVILNKWVLTLGLKREREWIHIISEDKEFQHQGAKRLNATVARQAEGTAKQIEEDDLREWDGVVK